MHSEYCLKLLPVCNTCSNPTDIVNGEDSGKKGHKGPKIESQGEAEIKPNDDVHKDIEVGGSGNNDADEPSQFYASISAEHKAKKRLVANNFGLATTITLCLAIKLSLVSQVQWGLGGAHFAAV